MEQIFDRASRDGDVLVEAGIDGLLVENFGDLPFFKDRVPPVTIAAMAVLIDRIRRRVRRDDAAGSGRIPSQRRSPPIGINVLRNDARAALSIAAVTGASFIRVNVHAGVTATDQGLIEGQAAETLRLRRELAPDVAVFADVRVKHARPLADRPLAEDVADLAERGLVDAILLTGDRTGLAPDPEDAARAKDAAGEVPLWLASGISARNVSRYLDVADGIIIGSALKKGGRIENPVDPSKVGRFLRAARNVRHREGRSRRRSTG